MRAWSDPPAGRVSVPSCVPQGSGHREIDPEKRIVENCHEETAGNESDHCAIESVRHQVDKARSAGRARNLPGTTVDQERSADKSEQGYQTRIPEFSAGLDENVVRKSADSVVHGVVLRPIRVADSQHRVVV